MKPRVENVRFFLWRIFFVGKYGIQSTNEIAFKRTAPLYKFSISTIRFDALTLLSFSGCTHSHAKCPPVGITNVSSQRSMAVLSSRAHERRSRKKNQVAPAPISSRFLCPRPPLLVSLRNRTAGRRRRQNARV